MDQNKITDLLFKNFVGDRQDWKPEVMGIHYSDGYLYATNGFILAKVHFEEYDFDFEDRTISKNGSEVVGKFPTLEKLFINLEEIDVLVSQLFKVCRNLKIGTNQQGGFVCVLIDGFIFHIFQLKAILELFELIGEIPKIKTGSNATQKTLVFSSANCTAICISDFRTLTSKDLVFTIDEALDFNQANKQDDLY